MRLQPATIVRTLRKNQGRVRKTARDLGVSPATVILWRDRAGDCHDWNLRLVDRHSTRPHRLRGRVLTTTQYTRAYDLRRQTGYSAYKVKYLLKLPVHWSTIHRYFKATGCIPDRIKYRRPRLQPTRHMHAKNALQPGKLQMDVKHVTPQLSGLPHTVYLYALMDIFSRYKQGLFLPMLNQKGSWYVLSRLRQTLPFQPDFIQTDNGLEFQSGFHELVTNRLHWHHHYIHKNAPNENAVIERSFRTDQDEFFRFRMKRPRSLRDLNTQYQRYLTEYNTERPHLSLEMLTPIEKLQSVQNVC